MALIFIFLILFASTYLVAKAFRKRMNHWGSTPEEQALRLPGEAFLSNTTVVSTHAITINASPEDIWPWLIQIGVGRGGFYSYSWLENLVGCGVRNADRVVGELQNLKLGDEIFLHPQAPPLRVTYLSKNRSLAFEGWMFELLRPNSRQTRLLSRTYAFPDDKKSLAARFSNFAAASALYDLAHFIMSRKQLIQIKSLVENSKKIVKDVRLSGGKI